MTAVPTGHLDLDIDRFATRKFTRFTVQSTPYATNFEQNLTPRPDGTAGNV